MANETSEIIDLTDIIEQGKAPEAKLFEDEQISQMNDPIEPSLEDLLKSLDGDDSENIDMPNEKTDDSEDDFDAMFNIPHGSEPESSQKNNSNSFDDIFGELDDLIASSTPSSPSIPSDKQEAKDNILAPVKAPVKDDTLELNFDDLDDILASNQVENASDDSLDINLDELDAILAPNPAPVTAPAKVPVKAPVKDDTLELNLDDLDDILASNQSENTSDDSLDINLDDLDDILTSSQVENTSQDDTQDINLDDLDDILAANPAPVKAPVKDDTLELNLDDLDDILASNQVENTSQDDTLEQNLDLASSKESFDELSTQLANQAILLDEIQKSLVNKVDLDKITELELKIEGKLASDFKQLNAELEQSKAQMEILSSQNTQLEQNLSIALAKIAMLNPVQVQIESLSTQNTQLEQDLTAALAEIASLQAQNDGLSADLQKISLEQENLLLTIDKTVARVAAQVIQEEIKAMLSEDEF